MPSFSPLLADKVPGVAHKAKPVLQHKHPACELSTGSQLRERNRIAQHTDTPDCNEIIVILPLPLLLAVEGDLQPIDVIR